MQFASSGNSSIKLSKNRKRWRLPSERTLALARLAATTRRKTCYRLIGEHFIIRGRGTPLATRDDNGSRIRNIRGV